MSDNLAPIISPIKKQVFLITFTFKRENKYAIQLLFVLIWFYICLLFVLYSSYTRLIFVLYSSYTRLILRLI